MLLMYLRYLKHNFRELRLPTQYAYCVRYDDTKYHNVIYILYSNNMFLNSKNS